MKQIQANLTRIIDSWFGVILLVISLFFLQCPYFFAVIPVITISIPYVKWIMILLLGICTLVLHGNLKRLFREELLLWAAVLWCVILCISMRINGKGLHDVVYDIIPSVLLGVLVISVFTRVNVRRFLFVLFFYFLVINTLNNVSALFFINNGIWLGPFGASDPEYIFFGHINEGITCGINSILFGLICSRQYGKQWDLVNGINLLFSICTAWAIDCKVQLVVYAAAVIVLVSCYLADKWHGLWKILNWINLKTIMIFNLVVFFAVVVLGNTGWMELVGINSNMHSRRELWNTVLGSIREHPVIGLGYTTWINTMMRYGIEKTFWHQHSVYLMIMYETGIVGTLVFVFMFVLAIISLGKLKRTDLRFVIGALVGVFFLAMIVEVCLRSEIFLLLAVCCYIPRFLEQPDSR